MADIDNWDASKPAIGTSLRNSNPQILNNWAALADALNDDHNVFTNGYHNKVTLVDAVAPSAIADHTIIYATSGVVYAKTTTGTTTLSSFTSGTKMYFYQNTAPTGWTIDGTVADALLAVKGGSDVYNVNGGNLAGSWSFTVTGTTDGGSPSAVVVTSDQSGVNVDKSESHVHTFTSTAKTDYRPYGAVGIIATKD